MRDRDAHTAGADEVTDMEINEADGSNNPRQIRLDAQNKVLPNRLHRLRKLSWFECWLSQLRSEKKSIHTIRAYERAAQGNFRNCLAGRRVGLTKQFS